MVNADNGTLAARYEYDPYGRLLFSRGPYAGTNPFRFSTKYTDTETGLAYFGYRYYNPETGRWINRDPIAESASTNLYEYVRSDPLNLVDFLGGVAACTSPECGGLVVNPPYPWVWPDVWEGAKCGLKRVAGKVVTCCQKVVKVGGVVFIVLTCTEDAGGPGDVIDWPYPPGDEYWDDPCHRTCPGNVYDALRQTVQSACKDGALSTCYSTDSTSVLISKMLAFGACAAARANMMVTCFNGGGPGHIQAYKDVLKDAANCGRILSKRLTANGPRQY